MTWFTAENSWEEVLASTPHIAQRYTPYYDAYWELPQIPATTLELCRLRVAQLHQCDTEFVKEKAALPPGKKASLSNWNSDDSFSGAERACIEFTEIYTMDCESVSDELADAVKAHYGDAGLVALVQALGLFYGMTRLSLLWDL